MSEYGSGITMGRQFSYDKERIKHAFKGELLCGEDEDGFIYDKAPKEECERFILRAFDNAVYQCLHLSASGRAVERIMTDAGIDFTEAFQDYIRYVEEEHQRFNDYKFEGEIADEDID